MAQLVASDKRGQPVLDGRRLHHAERQRRRQLVHLLVPRRTASRRLRHAQAHLLPLHGCRSLARSLVFSLYRTVSILAFEEKKTILL